MKGNPVSWFEIYVSCGVRSFHPSHSGVASPHGPSPPNRTRRWSLPCHVPR